MMLDVARNGAEGEPVSLTAISERTDISRAYLEQVAISLRAARLIRGVSGRHGGYWLATPPSEIKVSQVLEALLGPVCLVDCIESSASCPRSDYCECRVMYQLINDRILEAVQSHTLADLLDPSWVHRYGGAKRPQGEFEAVDGFGCNPSPKHASNKQSEQETALSGSSGRNRR
jgi:Rrf2 family protein